MAVDCVGLYEAANGLQARSSIRRTRIVTLARQRAPEVNSMRVLVPKCKVSTQTHNCASDPWGVLALSIL